MTAMMAQSIYNIYINDKNMSQLCTLRWIVDIISASQSGRTGSCSLVSLSKAETSKLSIRTVLGTGEYYISQVLKYILPTHGSAEDQELVVKVIYLHQVLLVRIQY